MAGTLTGLLAASAAEIVILAEASPLYVLSGWTSSAPTYANTYQIAMPRAVQASRFPGGIYRRVSGLRENGTDLTAQTSAANVDANAGTWFWDETAEILYVRTSSGASPDTFTVYAAYVTFYFATSGVVVNRVDGDASTGIYYQPWLSGQLPTKREEVEDLLFGVKLETMGSVAFTNTHGFFNTITATNSLYAWKNTRIRFLVWGRYNGQELLRSDAGAVATMEVDNIVSDERAATFTLKPLARTLELEIPPTPIFESDYPNLGDGVRGTRKWIGYGRATIAPDLVDKSGNGVYLVADAAYQTLYAVNAVYAVAANGDGARTTLGLGVDYSVDLTACTVTIINAAYAWQSYGIEVDATGKPDGLGSYLKTGPAIIQDMLTTFVGVQAADLDASAFATAATDAPQECALWIKSQRTISSVLANAARDLPALERSCLATVRQTLAGLWTIGIWKPSIDYASAITMQRSDFAKFGAVPKLQTVFARVRVHYGYNHAIQAWQVAEAYDARTEYLTRSKDALDVYTFLVSSSDALTLAQRIQLVSASISTEIEFEERGAKLAQALGGDRVLITFDPAPHAEDGQYNSEPFEIVLLETSFAPKVTVAGRFGDLRGIGRTIGRWAASTVPTYASASADEKANNGFWSDASGYVTPGDASTKNVSRWW